MNTVKKTTTVTTEANVQAIYLLKMLYVEGFAPLNIEGKVTLPHCLVMGENDRPFTNIYILQDLVANNNVDLCFTNDGIIFDFGDCTPIVLAYLEICKVYGGFGTNDEFGNHGFVIDTYDDLTLLSTIIKKSGYSSKVVKWHDFENEIILQINM